MNIAKFFKSKKDGLSSKVSGNFSWKVPGNFCFYCSADSFELKTFLILVIGGLCLCSVFIFWGLYLKGQFKNTEQMNDLPIKVEEQD